MVQCKLQLEYQPRITSEKGRVGRIPNFSVDIGDTLLTRQEQTCLTRSTFIVEHYERTEGMYTVVTVVTTVTVVTSSTYLE